MQTPPLHRPEQHWALSPQGLPAVRQTVLSGAQTPPVHVPPQQAVGSEQAWPSAMQALALQRPPEQASEQHSVADWQPPPAAVQ